MKNMFVKKHTLAVLNALIILCIFRVEAEAILPENRVFFVVTDLTAISVDVEKTSEVDMTIDPEYSGSIVNTRFTHVSDLEKVTNMILSFKKENPHSTPWAVFDVDETLIDRTHPEKPIHPKTDELLKRLNDEKVPIFLLTMSSPPKPKFLRANLTYEGVIQEGLLSRDRYGVFIPKGKRLQKYINTLPSDRRPSHVFFADDQLFTDPGVESVLGKIAVYIESVESTMREMRIPFTTFHFQK
jgi:predicted HAD superfamily phosphohydrolase YqeG